MNGHVVHHKMTPGGVAVPTCSCGECCVSLQEVFGKRIIAQVAVAIENAQSVASLSAAMLRALSQGPGRVLTMGARKDTADKLAAAVAKAVATGVRNAAEEAIGIELRAGFPACPECVAKVLSAGGRPLTEALH